MMAGFQAEENLTGRAPKKCAKNSGRYLQIFTDIVREVIMEDFLVDLDDRGFLLLGGFVSRHGMALLSEVCLVTKL